MDENRINKTILNSVLPQPVSFHKKAFEKKKIYLNFFYSNSNSVHFAIVSLLAHHRELCKD